MSSWAAALLSVSIIRKKESPIEAFKRTAELVENQHNKAIVDLECATKVLVEEIEKKLQ